jgi:hypothetical protein
MLAIYRLGIFIPLPGVDVAALKEFFARAEGTLLGLFNLFSGGAMENASVFCSRCYAVYNIINHNGDNEHGFSKVARTQKAGRIGKTKNKPIYTIPYSISELLPGNVLVIIFGKYTYRSRFQLLSKVVYFLEYQAG